MGTIRSTHRRPSCERPLRALVGVMLLAGLAVPAVGATPGGETAPTVYVVVFDFATVGRGTHGKRLADSLRLRLRRHKGCEVIDRLTTQSASGPLGVGTDPNRVIKLMAEKVGANRGAFGSVQVDGDLVRAEVCLVDLTGGKPAVTRKVFSDRSERAAGVIAGQIVEALLGEAEWTPPEYGDEDEPAAKAFARPLNANGDFESAGHVGWHAPDNVSTFIERGPAKRRKVLRIRTDLQRKPWLRYQRDLRFGRADPNRPPTIDADSSYGSVAGWEGVHYRSDWIDATAGQRYWLRADMKGKTIGIFFPKIEVKGYFDASAQAKGLPELSLIQRKLTPRQFADLPVARRKKLIADDAKTHPERYRRECWRWYLACRNTEGTWQHYAAPLPPRGGLPAKVKWLRIEVYAYWPPGTYYFDNVRLCKDPRQKAPLPEEPARTPNQARDRGDKK